MKITNQVFLQLSVNPGWADLENLLKMIPVSVDQLFELVEDRNGKIFPIVNVIGRDDNGCGRTIAGEHVINIQRVGYGPRPCCQCIDIVAGNTIKYQSGRN